MRASLAKRVGAVLLLHERAGLDHLPEEALGLGARHELALAGLYLGLEDGEAGVRRPPPQRGAATCPDGVAESDPEGAVRIWVGNRYAFFAATSALC